jgi:tetratricopeptide (TPR) repeat protein
VISPEEIGARYFRLALGAAEQRDLSAALGYVSFARILDPGHGGAARLEELCRYELGTDGDEGQGLEKVGLLAGKKKWKEAANAARDFPRQNARLLNIQGCLWALAKRYARAADCFARALAVDRGDRLAAEALAGLARQRAFFWRFF